MKYLGAQRILRGLSFNDATKNHAIENIAKYGCYWLSLRQLADGEKFERMGQRIYDFPEFTPEDLIKDYLAQATTGIITTECYVQNPTKVLKAFDPENTLYLLEAFRDSDCGYRSIRCFTTKYGTHFVYKEDTEGGLEMTLKSYRNFNDRSKEEKKV